MWISFFQLSVFCKTKRGPYKYTLYSVIAKNRTNSKYEGQFSCSDQVAPGTRMKLYLFCRNDTNKTLYQASRITLMLETLLDGYDKRLRPNLGGKAPYTV